MNHRCLLLLAGLLLALAATQCSRDLTGPTADPDVRDAGRPYLAGEVPEEDSGNCLSFPVIWSDGVAKTLRGTFGEETFEGPSITADDPLTPEPDLVPWYLQGDPNNIWQAESRDQLPLGALEVSRIDWGDNLEAKAWYEGSVVRTELVMFQDLPPGEEMVGYQMLKLNDASGLSEVWGTNGAQYFSTQATVYSACARLTIQKLSVARDDPELSLTWNPVSGEWEGDIAATVFNGGVWEGGDGPGYYSAELNVQGKCIYGYNWYVSAIPSAPGDYRITFSMSGSDAGRDLNTFLTSSTVIDVPVEEVIEAILEEEGDSGEPDHLGGIAAIVPEFNLTYIDVRILESHGSGGGGNGPGPGGGGGGKNGGGGSGH